MSTFIYRIHEAVRSARTTRRGASAHPEYVKTGGHKEYTRLPRISLPEASKMSALLDETIIARRSFKSAISLDGFSEDDIGTLLGVALGAETPSQRHYPSGGALFPIETYLVGSVFLGHVPAAYHYHPTAHALEHLVDLPNFSTLDITTTRNVPAGSALILFTGVWERSSAKYGDLAYLHGAIECGHMAQNILLAATARGIAARPVAGFRDTDASKILDLGDDEQPIYAIVLAKSGGGSTDQTVND